MPPEDANDPCEREMTLEECRDLIDGSGVLCCGCSAKTAVCLSKPGLSAFRKDGHPTSIVSLCDDCCGHSGEEGECLFLDPERT